jgi:hypothetical protein
MAHRFLLALVTPACAWKVSFADTSYTSVFSEQWSYDQQTQDGHDRHFDVGRHGGRDALRVRIYHNDKAFTSSSPTAPRSELSQKSKTDLVQDVEYTASWDWQLESYTSPYYFAFMQLFGGSGPNIFLRWEFDKYILWCEACSTYRMDFEGNAANDVGKWIHWEVRFKLSTSNGYLRVLRDGKEVKSYQGVTSTGPGHYLKLGLYTQHAETAMDTSALLSSLEVTQGSASTYCSRGIEHGGACCAAACGSCGGSGCGSLPGGSSQCCSGTILNSGVICKKAEDVACIIPALVI